VYGPREYFKDKTSSMIMQLGHQILSGNSPRLFKGSEKIFRDFIYIEDVIQANIKACSSRSNGTFNIGTGFSRSFQDVSDILQKELGTNMETDYFKNPYKAYQKHTQADISLSKEEFDFNPQFDLETGIKSYIPEIEYLFDLYIK
jgi:ADP-L-glycero-D-manno-heptose 6-epimerase